MLISDVATNNLSFIIAITTNISIIIIIFLSLLLLLFLSRIVFSC